MCKLYTCIIISLNFYMYIYFTRGQIQIDITWETYKELSFVHLMCLPVPA